MARSLQPAPLRQDPPLLGQLDLDTPEENTRHLRAWVHRLRSYLTDQAAVLEELYRVARGCGSGCNRRMGLTILAPGAAEDSVIAYVPYAGTITSVSVVLLGSTPSVDFNVVHGTDRSAAGTSLFVSDRTTVNETDGESYANFDGEPGVVAGSWVRITTSAASGTIDELAVSIAFQET